MLLRNLGIRNGGVLRILCLTLTARRRDSYRESTGSCRGLRIGLGRLTRTDGDLCWSREEAFRIFREDQ